MIHISSSLPTNGKASLPAINPEMRSSILSGRIMAMYESVTIIAIRKNINMLIVVYI
jgi:hypothetical protein